MREIKFRMWSKEYQQMFGMTHLSAMYTVCAKLAKKYVPEVCESEIDMPLTGVSLPFQDDAVLMQYTGLHDKNGKEIYDKDICEFSYISPLSQEEVKYVWVVKIEPTLTWLRSCDGQKHDTALYMKHSQVKVIGNIYENQELLEEAAE